MMRRSSEKNLESKRKYNRFLKEILNKLSQKYKWKNKNKQKKNKQNKKKKKKKYSNRNPMKISMNPNIYKINN